MRHYICLILENCIEPEMKANANNSFNIYFKIKNNRYYKRKITLRGNKENL